MFHLGSQFFIELLLSVEQNVNLKFALQGTFSARFKLVDLHFAIISELLS